MRPANDENESPEKKSSSFSSPTKKQITVEK